MSPELLELVRFVSGLLVGAIVAVFAQRSAFHDARQLQRDERAAREDSLRRGLLAEVQENIYRTNQQTPIRISRGAWEAAQHLEWKADSDLPADLRHAYALGEDLNSRTGILDR